MVAFGFRRQVAFVKFIGTHAEYDRTVLVATSGSFDLGSVPQFRYSHPSAASIGARGAV